MKLTTNLNYFTFEVASYLNKSDKWNEVTSSQQNHEQQLY